MTNHEELLLTLSERRNAVAYHEAEIVRLDREHALALRPHQDALRRAENELADVEEEVLVAMDAAGVDSLHSDARHFTAYVQDTSGYRVIDEDELVAALTERGVKIPYRKQPKPQLALNQAKKIAVEQFGGDLPGIAFVEHRTVQVKGTER